MFFFNNSIRIFVRFFSNHYSIVITIMLGIIFSLYLEIEHGLRNMRITF